MLFLHGFVDEELYLQPPQGLEIPNGMVCKLSKALYGLKQAFRQWYKEFSSKLVSYGFKQSKFDHCLFLKSNADHFIVLVVYVDDILVTGTNQNEIRQVKEFLHREFTIKDLGQADYFLGIGLVHSSQGIFISQHKYISNILQDTHLLDAKPAPTPFPVGCKL